MGLQVLRDMGTALHNAELCSLMVDQTTDISNKEQAVRCFRWVSGDLIVHEEFFGLYGIVNYSDSGQHNTRCFNTAVVN